MLDVVVIGSGPNGLAGAATLARAGKKVLVLESQATAGGALRSVSLTEPGFVHDLGAAFFPFAHISPAFRALELGSLLTMKSAPFDSAHLASDGSSGMISRDLARSTAELGERDGAVWRELVEWFAAHADFLVPALLSTFPDVGKFARVSPAALARFGVLAAMSPAALGERLFTSEAARRMVAGLALHADLGPDDFAGVSVGLMLGLLAAVHGFTVPEGGAQKITDALRQRLEDAGGSIRTSTRVVQVIVKSGRAVGVRTAGGDEIEARAVLADTGPISLLLDLVGQEHLGAALADRVRRFEYAWGTFKLDWALDGPVPWKNAACRETAVVHLGESLSSLRLFTEEVRAGRLPEQPYLLVGQQSLMDAARAPAGKHTLYAYTHVPSVVAGGWAQERERFADRVEGWIEACAPGFRALVRSRAIHSPVDLERVNENLVGGDLGGGTSQIQRQLVLRPLFPYFRYRMPLRGLYLGSASTHPGTGVHGMCGYNAAQAILADQP